MKKNITVFLTIVFIAFAMVSCASTPVSQESQSEIIEIPGKTADSLFVLANSWMVDAMNNADSVIQYSDKAEGIIKGKYINYYYSMMGTDYYAQTIITVQVKDGRARIQLDPGELWAIANGKRYSNYSTGADTSQLDLSRQKLIGAFKLAMTNNSVSDW